MTEGVWAFEGIGDDLDLVPIAARRALDEARLHLSLEGWRSLAVERRGELVRAGVADDVDVALVRRITSESAVPCRVIEQAPLAEELRLPDVDVGLPEELARRVAARWGSFRAVERFAILHAVKSAARRRDPERVAVVVRAIAGDGAAR